MLHCSHADGGTLRPVAEERCRQTFRRAHEGEDTDFQEV